MISTDEFLKWFFRGLFAISIGVIGYFLHTTIDDLKSRPTEAQVRVIINTELKEVKNNITRDRERIIKVEQALINLSSISKKLDNMDNKLDKACEDIASIKAKK